MRISDWSSDVCSSDLAIDAQREVLVDGVRGDRIPDRVRLCVRRRADRTIGTAMHLAGITRATADREAVRQAVRGPAGERFAGGVRQIRRSVAGDGRTFRDLGALVDIAGADRTVVREVDVGRQVGKGAVWGTGVLEGCKIGVGGNI